jgi:adenylylsulfate kinase
MAARASKMTDEKSNKGFCIWLMGLSASGKTTLAHLLKKKLVDWGLIIEVLDGDVVRSTISKELGFTRSDRETHLRRIASMVKSLIDQQIIVIVAAICPYQTIREELRFQIGDFVEVYLNCPIEICIQRDPKGLYRKALAGKIKNFTGIDDPFETPYRPEIVIKTDEESPDESLERLLVGLKALKRFPPALQSGYK